MPRILKNKFNYRLIVKENEAFKNNRAYILFFWDVRVLVYKAVHIYSVLKNCL